MFILIGRPNLPDCGDHMRVVPSNLVVVTLIGRRRRCVIVTRGRLEEGINRPQVGGMLLSNALIPIRNN